MLFSPYPSETLASSAIACNRSFSVDSFTGWSCQPQAHHSKVRVVTFDLFDTGSPTINYVIASFALRIIWLPSPNVKPKYRYLSGWGGGGIVWTTELNDSLQQSPNLEADRFLASRAVPLILWTKTFHCLVRSTLPLLPFSSHVTCSLRHLILFLLKNGQK